MVEEVLTEAHMGKYTIHPGATKISLQVLLQALEIPEWKWASISKDFVVGLPRSQAEFDSIWFAVDRLTKSAYFLPVKTTFSTEQLARLYVREIVKLHCVPESIISDRDPKFTSRFWGALHDALGTQLRLSTTYHPHKDRQTERTIQTLEDILRACALEQGNAWDKCRTLTCWNKVGEKQLLGSKLVQETTKQIEMIRDRLKKALSHQKSYYDRKHRPMEFSEGDHMFIRLSPTTGVGHAFGSEKVESTVNVVASKSSAVAVQMSSAMHHHQQAMDPSPIS
ncbi:uncharacterized protein LOC133310511 [Gastrolobium bilobum]|uniref:uncharacterized protein LOC133310511 n=1 Tax=Gastrolobium bilobum TaxID=150636 RepID=UPI002AAFC37F|nr:uncharacterized protein LOC133310511 [Gastrolobium bilobum]